MTIHVFNYSNSAEIPYQGDHPTISKVPEMKIKENVAQEIKKVAALFQEGASNPSPHLKTAITTLTNYLAETMSGTRPHNIDDKNILHYSTVKKDENDRTNVKIDVTPLLDDDVRTGYAGEIDLQAIDSNSDQNIKAQKKGVIPIALITIKHGGQIEEYVACALRGKKILILTNILKPLPE